jgi:hypothetical protein
MTETEDNEVAGIGWYVSDTHCRRAIGYLYTNLATKGHLAADFEAPLLLKMWGEALANTLDVREPSPIGPDPELAKEILGHG